jgi:hypothetical protein
MAHYISLSALVAVHELAASLAINRRLLFALAFFWRAHCSAILLFTYQRFLIIRIISGA